MITLDLDKAIELLHEAVEDRGADYIDMGANGDGGCAYVVSTPDGHQAGCIVGWVLHRVGVKVEDLIPLDSMGSLACIQPIILQQSYGIEMDWRAHAVLRKAQAEQDSGTAWGLAVDRALADASADV